MKTLSIKGGIKATLMLMIAVIALLLVIGLFYFFVLDWPMNVGGKLGSMVLSPADVLQFIGPSDDQSLRSKAFHQLIS